MLYLDVVVEKIGRIFTAPDYFLNLLILLQGGRRQSDTILIDGLSPVISSALRVVWVHRNHLDGLIRP